MKTNLLKNTFASKLILYTSAALLLTTSPFPVYATGETAQTESSPSNTTNTESTEAASSETTSSENASSENASSEASKPEESSSAVSSEPTSSEAASTEASKAEESSTPESASSPSPKPENNGDTTSQDKLPQQSDSSNNTTNTTSDNNFDVTPMQATVYAATQSGLNVRSGPSTNYEKLGTLKYGQEITVTGKIGNDWYQILYSNGYGYVSAQYVSDTPLNTENPSDPEDSLNPATDAEAGAESPSTEADTEAFSGLLGTPVIIALVIAIFGVIALIVYSVYGLFKRDTTSENGDMYFEDEDDDAQYNDIYSEDEYDDDAQYDDMYSEDEYDDDTQYDDMYSEDEYDNENDVDNEYESDTYSENEDDEQEFDKNIR